MSKRRDRSTPAGTFLDKLQAFTQTPSEKVARIQGLTSTLLLATGEPTIEDKAAAEVHVMLGYRDKQGDRLVDRFLRAEGKKLTPEERRVGAAWQRAWYSVFVVHDTGKGAYYEDQLFGGRYRVPGSLLTREMAPRAVVFCWMVPEEDGIPGEASCVGTPAVLILYPQPKALILATLQQGYRRVRPADDEEAKERLRQSSFNMHLLPRMMQRMEKEGRIGDIAAQLPFGLN